MSFGPSSWLRKRCSYPFWMCDNEKAEDGYSRIAS